MSDAMDWTQNAARAAITIYEFGVATKPPLLNRNADICGYYMIWYEKKLKAKSHLVGRLIYRLTVLPPDVAQTAEEDVHHLNRTEPSLMVWWVSWFINAAKSRRARWCRNRECVCYTVGVFGWWDIQSIFYYRFWCQICSLIILFLIFLLCNLDVTTQSAFFY